MKMFAGTVERKKFSLIAAGWRTQKYVFAGNETSLHRK
jgi:hypothetical protein